MSVNIPTKFQIVETTMYRKLNTATTMQDVINHLQDKISDISKMDPDKMDLVEFLITALQPHCQESLATAFSTSRIKGQIRTFFAPSCRILKVNLYEEGKRSYHNVSKMRQEHVEDGFDMKPATWAHSALTVKIEYNTDYTVFANWTHL